MDQRRSPDLGVGEKPMVLEGIFSVNQLTKGILSIRSTRSDNPTRSKEVLILGCPVDSNVFSCLIHYAPEVLSLVVLALVCIAGVAFRKSHQ